MSPVGSIQMYPSVLTMPGINFVKTSAQSYLGSSIVNTGLFCSVLKMNPKMYAEKNTLFHAAIKLDIVDHESQVGAVPDQSWIVPENPSCFRHGHVF